MKYIDDHQNSFDSHDNRRRSRSMDSFESRRTFAVKDSMDEPRTTFVVKENTGDISIATASDETTFHSDGTPTSSVTLDKNHRIIRTSSVSPRKGRSQKQILQELNNAHAKRISKSRIAAADEHNPTISVHDQNWKCNERMSGRKNASGIRSKSGISGPIYNGNSLKSGKRIAKKSHPILHSHSDERFNDESDDLRMVRAFEVHDNEEEDKEETVLYDRYRNTVNKNALIRPMLLTVGSFVKDALGGGESTMLVKGGILQGKVQCIYISAEKYADIEGSTNLMMTLRNQRGNVVEQLDLFGKSPNEKYRSFRYRTIDDNEPIISEARRGFYYQLDYQIQGMYEDTITVTGLICKIIPASKATPSFEMTDPEGLKGRYVGDVDVRGKAEGQGTFHYETGCTFVGEFKVGKWIKGAYYRGTLAKGSMKEGQWDDDLDMSLVQKFPYDVHVYAARSNSKTVGFVKRMPEKPVPWEVENGCIC